ncbi:[protein-PII] uridylyltransferase family protein [Spirochaeta dissipatitropha]
MSYAAEVREALPPRYFSGFSEDEQAQHSEDLESLGPEGQFRVRIDSLMEGCGDDDQVTAAGCTRVKLTVIAYDVPGLFSVLAGTLAVMGCEINSGISCTARPDNSGSYRRLTEQRRRIIDVFTGSLESSLDFEVWRVQSMERIESGIERLCSAGADAVRLVQKELAQAVAEQLDAGSAVNGTALPPVSTDISVGEYGTKISLTSKDTPFFLYSAANALSLHGVSIEGVEIYTRDGLVEDIFELVDNFGRPLDDTDQLEHLRFSLVFTKQFTYHLTAAPDPFTALQRFDELMQELMKVSQRADMRDTLSDPGLQDELARLLGASDFLWEDFIRQQHEQIVPLLTRESRGRVLSLDDAQVGLELDSALDEVQGSAEKIRILNEFKDREIYRIDIDHILHPDLDFFFLSRRLVRLAEEVIRAALDIAYESAVNRWGVPRTAGGMTASFAVFGLGKLGGEALGYASDLELLCMYADSGKTDGENSCSNRSFFEKMFTEAMRAIKARKEGIFQVDLRLRPHGEDGPIACTLESFMSYYQRGGGAHSYERLALIRLRHIAGDRSFGAQVERMRDELVYHSDSIDLPELRELRNQQLQHKSEDGRSNAKFSPGALVDLEYNVQILQVEFAGRYPQLRTSSVHEALKGLSRAGALERGEVQQLVDAYRFFRHLINGLRMLRGNAKDLFLPDKSSVEFSHLARRMGYAGSSVSPADQLYMDFQQRTAEVRSIVERRMGRGAIPGEFLGNILDFILREDLDPEDAVGFFSRHGFSEPLRALEHIRMLDSAAPRDFRRIIVLAFDVLGAQPDPDLALLHWTQLAERLPAGPHYATLAKQPKRMQILFGLLSVSRFLSDILIQNPDFFDWVTEPATVARLRSLPELKENLENWMQNLDDDQERDALRRFRKREMLRIGTRDLQIAVPLKHTLTEISNLAQTVVAAALGTVWKRLLRESRITVASPERFCILAFGKFGGQELNYSSDIDLLAIYEPQSGQRNNQEEREYAQVIRQLSLLLSEFSVEGYAYRVDLRLRPFGASGDLAWSVPRILEYYRDSASLWEYQAMIKLRPVAGKLEIGEKFLLDVREYLPDAAQDERIIENIRSLREEAVQQYKAKQHRMQPSSDLSLEESSRVSQALNELPSLDIKNGVGGIRDIEFLVQGMQLLNGRSNPEIITGNTLEALRRLAKAGVVSSQGAAELAEHYLFLRRLEHLLQIFEDRQVHELPRNERALRRLARTYAGPDADPVDLLRDILKRTNSIRSMYDSFLQKCSL